MNSSAPSIAAPIKQSEGYLMAKATGHQSAYLYSSSHSIAYSETHNFHVHIPYLLPCFSRLGHFVKLMDQIILAHLVSIIRQTVSTFVCDTMQNVAQHEREAMFKCTLTFNEQGKHRELRSW